MKIPFGYLIISMFGKIILFIVVFRFLTIVPRHPITFHPDQYNQVLEIAYNMAFGYAQHAIKLWQSNLGMAPQRSHPEPTVPMDVQPHLSTASLVLIGQH